MPSPGSAPKTGTGPNGTFTPLDKFMKGGKFMKPKSPTVGRRKKRAIVLPDALLKAKVTPANLASGAYQKKILAWCAPHIAPGLMNSIMRGLEDDDPAARRLSAEMLNFVASGKGNINIALSQTNQTANVGRGPADGDDARSFEDMMRRLHEKRQHQALLPAGPIFDATPED